MQESFFGIKHVQNFKVVKYYNNSIDLIQGNPFAENGKRSCFLKQ